MNRRNLHKTSIETMCLKDRVVGATSGHQGRKGEGVGYGHCSRGARGDSAAGYAGEIVVGFGWHACDDLGDLQELQGQGLDSENMLKVSSGSDKVQSRRYWFSITTIFQEVSSNPGILGFSLGNSDYQLRLRTGDLDSEISVRFGRRRLPSTNRSRYVYQRKLRDSDHQLQRSCAPES